jgi:hypothetical protein
VTSVKPIGICTRPNCNSTTRIETDIGRPCLNHYCIGGTYRPVEPDELEGCKECYAEHVTLAADVGNCVPIAVVLGGRSRRPVDEN